MARPFRLSIVGGGPRSSYALERLAATARHRDLPASLIVDIFDPSGDFGSGWVHSPQQPFTSVLNRIADQVAFAVDDSAMDADHIRPRDDRPTLAEWCASRFLKTGERRYDISGSDWPSRAVHGEALQERFRQHCSELRARGITVNLHPQEVLDVREGDHDTLLLSAGDATVPAHHVLLVTGHPLRSDASDPSAVARREFAERIGLSHLPRPYPLHDLDAAIPPASTVALEGTGLSAIDVVLHLTEGRGGRFLGSGEAMEYERSGDEPQAIILCSTSGALPLTRPENRKRSEYSPRFFTPGTVDTLRTRTETGQLDFDDSILPLVVLEMALAFYSASYGQRVGDDLAHLVEGDVSTFLLRGMQGGAERLLPAVERGVDRLPSPHERFSWQRHLDYAVARPDLDRASFETDLAGDLRRAARGNVEDPTHAALDGVWRDCRKVFAHAVDFGGLTANSHRAFVSHTVRLTNKFVNGASAATMARILALHRSGLLDATAGRDARIENDETARCFRVVRAGGSTHAKANIVIGSHVDAFDARRDTVPLFNKAVRRGLMRLWATRTPGEPDFVPGYLDIDDRGHPRSAEGDVDSRLVVRGAPAALSSFFPFSAMRPAVDHPVARECISWVEEFWRAYDAATL